MHLRRASEKDIDRIMEILEEGRASLASLGIDQWQGGYPQRSIIEQDQARGESFVVEDEQGCLQATVMIGCNGEKDYLRIDQGKWLTSLSLERPHYVVIHRVAVTQAAKERGTASFILREAEEFARASGFLSVRIDTHPGNVPMINLLKKSGYTRCGIIYIAHSENQAPERFAYEKIVLPYESFDHLEQTA